MKRAILAGLTLLGFVHLGHAAEGVPGSTGAQDEVNGPRTTPPPEREWGEPGPKVYPTEPPVPYQRDLVGGHVQLGLSGGFAAPGGSVAQDVPQGARAGFGEGIQGDLSYGISRHLMVGAYAENYWLGASGKCPDCRAQSFGAGVVARYFLAQGLRLNPWVSYGVGYTDLRSTSPGLDATYAGLDWMRLQMGADWSLSKNFSVAPTVGLNAGTMVDRPDEEFLGGPYVRLHFGLRFALDLPGR